MSTYYELREEVWPYGYLWGDREERKAVRTYLRIVWQEHNDTYEMNRASRHGVRQEKNLILRWWWYERSPYEGWLDTRNVAFGYWLLREYQDANKITYPDNRQRGRN